MLKILETSYKWLYLLANGILGLISKGLVNIGPANISAQILLSHIIIGPANIKPLNYGAPILQRP